MKVSLCTQNTVIHLNTMILQGHGSSGLYLFFIAIFISWVTFLQ